MKHVYLVTAKFPEAPAAHAYQECRVDASSLSVAARRGLEELKAMRHLKNRRLSTVTLTIVRVQ